MFLERGTGVPNYIACLYRKCLETDRSNEYIFFQPDASRTLGRTEVAPVPHGIWGAPLFDLVRVQPLIRHARLDVYHAPAHFLPRRRIAGVKYVVTVHDLAFRLMPEQYDWKHRWYFGWQLARSLRMADAVVAVSHNTKRDVVNLYHIPEERIHVVHHGVAEHFLHPPDPPEARLIADKYFFSVTTHPTRKNILGALKAFAMLPPQNRPRYVIAGVMGELQRQELIACAGRLGVQDQVELFGYADDRQLINLYQNAECLIYPSFYEGFGFPVVEAMACGCPVITSNTSALPELMPDQEWLVDPYQPAAIAGKMQQVLALTADNRQAVVETNREFARGFTWEKAATRMIELFENLHARSR